MVKGDKKMNQDEWSEHHDQLIVFCRSRGFTIEESLAIGLLCKKEENAKKFLQDSKECKDFYECLQIAAKINKNS